MDNLISKREAIDALTKIRIKRMQEGKDVSLVWECYDKIMHVPTVQPELTDDMAIKHLCSTGWMQNHDKEMYEMGLRERLADDSDSYDSLIPPAQPLVLTCDGCRFIGRYDTDFPCSRCIRRDEDYYEQER